jgi:outer membrane protein assembly factor BamB
MHVLCLSTRTGEILWQRDFISTAHKLHERNTYATSTPVVDNQRVYVAWSDPSKVTFMALDHSGNQVWKHDLGAWTSQHGFGLSPIRYKDLVILSNSQQGEQLVEEQIPGKSRVMAFEAESGELRWETDRESASVCYSTPIIYHPSEGKPQLVNISTKEGVYSLDPETGEELWRIEEAFSMRTVSSPVLAGDILLGSTGSGGGGNYVSAFSLLTRENLYTIRRGAPYVSTLIVKDKLAFLFGDKGIVSAINVETGEVHWRERFSNGFSGSPIIAGDKVFCIADDGTVYVIAVSETFELLAENPLGEPTRSTPAVSGGLMFLRTESHLNAVRSIE